MAEGRNGPEVCARAGNAATQATMRLFVVMMRTDPLAIIRHVALKSGAQFPDVAATVWVTNHPLLKTTLQTHVALKSGAQFPDVAATVWVTNHPLLKTTLQTLTAKRICGM